MPVTGFTVTQTYDVFPTLPGLGWNFSRTPKWNTLIQRTASGLEAAAGLMSTPLWEWELTYDVLRADSTNEELQDLVGFFNSHHGMLIPFLLTDSKDSAVVTEGFGTGDGTTTIFQLSREFGGFSEPVIAPTGVIRVFVGGVEKQGTTDFAISTSGVVTFTTAPANAAALTWTGSYYWLVRFLQDESKFEEFMHDLWQNKKVSLLSKKQTGVVWTGGGGGVTPVPQDTLWTDAGTYIYPNNQLNVKIYDSGTYLVLGTGVTLTNAEGASGALCASFGASSATDDPTVWIEKTITHTPSANVPGALCVVTKKTSGGSAGNEGYAICGIQSYFEYAGGMGTSIALDAYVRATMEAQPDYLGLHGAWIRCQSDHGLGGLFIGCETNPGSADFGWRKEITSGQGRFVAGYVSATIMENGSMAYMVAPKENDKYWWHTGLFVDVGSIVSTAELWDSSKAYVYTEADGVIVTQSWCRRLDGATWKVYKAIQSGTNKDPLTETAYWTYVYLDPYGIDHNEAVFIGGAVNAANDYTGINYYAYIRRGIDFLNATFSKEAIRCAEGQTFLKWYDSTSGGAYLTGNKQSFYIKSGLLGFDNNQPIDWMNAAGVYKNLLNYNADDNFLIGSDLAAGKEILLQKDACFVQKARFTAYNLASPVAGDLWYYNSHLYFRIGTTSYQIDQQTPAESVITFTDITTNNASTSAHGFLKKLDNDATHFMNGQGAWAAPDHGSLGGLADDDHTQYAKVTGRASETLTLQNYLEMGNVKPIYFRNAANAAYMNMIYVTAADELYLGNDLASGKFCVNVDGTMRVVSCGASDSGGTGYRVLRVANA